MGMGWAQQLEIRLDGKLLKRFTIGGDAPGRPAPMSFTGPGENGDIEWEQYMQTEDESLEIRVPVQAGPRVVGVSYIREHLEPEDDPRPPERGRLLGNDDVYMDLSEGAFGRDRWPVRCRRHRGGYAGASSGFHLPS